MKFPKHLLAILIVALPALACSAAVDDAQSSDEAFTEGGPLRLIHKQISVPVDQTVAFAVDKHNRAEGLGGTSPVGVDKPPPAQSRKCEDLIAEYTKKFEIATLKGTADACAVLYPECSGKPGRPCFNGLLAATAPPPTLSVQATATGGSGSGGGVADTQQSGWQIQVGLTFTLGGTHHPTNDCQPANKDPGYATTIGTVSQLLLNIPECKAAFPAGAKD